MKRIISITVTLLLLASSFGVSFAVEALPTQVVQNISFSDIEILMVANSNTMTMAKNTLDKADYDYRQVLKSIKDIETKYNAIDLSAPGAWSTASSLSDQLVSLRANRDSLKYSLDNATINYEKQVRTNISVVQQQYISCLSLLNNLKISKNNLATLDKQLGIMATRLKLGYVSQNQYKVFNNQVLDARLSSAQLEEQTIIALEKLRNALGISAKKIISVSPLSTFDFSVIDKLIYSDDLTKVMANSISVKAAATNLESIVNASKKSYDPSKYQYSLKDMEIVFAQTKTATEENFKDQYTALKNSYSSLLISSRDLADKKIDLKTAELRYKLGLASQKQLSDLKTEIVNLELKYTNSSEALYLSYLQYESKKLGY